MEKSIANNKYNQTKIPILARLGNKYSEELIKLAAEEIATDDKLCEDVEFMQTGLYPIARKRSSTLTWPTKSARRRGRGRWRTLSTRTGPQLQAAVLDHWRATRPLAFGQGEGMDVPSLLVL